MTAPPTGWAAIAILCSVGALVGCAPSERETAFLARKALLLRQNQGIRELIDEAERGSLVPKDRFLIGIDEKVVADLFRSQLPLERPIKKNFALRLEEASVEFRDKFGIVVIEGNVHRRATPQRKTAVRIHGGLGAVQIDPKTDLLNIRIAIDDIEILEAGLLDRTLGRGGKNLLAKRGRGALEDALPDLKVPVGLARRIRLPAIQEGPISLDSLSIPLDISVERVIAVGGKLWITLDAEVGAVEGAERGLGVAVGKGQRSTRAGADSAAGPRAGQGGTR